MKVINCFHAESASSVCVWVWVWVCLCANIERKWLMKKFTEVVDRYN